MEQISRWRTGELIQDAMPNLSADDREFIKTGITPEEWNKYVEGQIIRRINMLPYPCTVKDFITFLQQFPTETKVVVDGFNYKPIEQYLSFR
jgi:hypothetical protein